MEINLPETPTLDKIGNIQAQSQPIGEFLEWLQNETKYSICEVYPEPRTSQFIPDELLDVEWHPTPKSLQDLLAEYFGIDQKAEEEERVALLDYARHQIALAKITEEEVQNAH